MFSFSSVQLTSTLVPKDPEHWANRLRNICSTGETSQAGQCCPCLQGQLALSADILIIMTQGGGDCCWHLRRQRPEMLLKHPTVHRSAPYRHRIMQPKMSAVQWVRNPGLEGLTLTGHLLRSLYNDWIVSTYIQSLVWVTAEYFFDELNLKMQNRMWTS